MSHSILNLTKCIQATTLRSVVPRISTSARLFSSIRSPIILSTPSTKRLPLSSYNLHLRQLSTTTTTKSKPSSNTRRNGIIGTLSIGSLLLGSYFYFNNGENVEEQLSNRHFIPLKVLRIEKLTQDTMKFTLSLPDELLPKIEEVSSVPIRSVYIMQPDLQIQRAYTALNADSFVRGKSGELDLVIKRYPDGEVSRWMHRLRVGDEVKVRGPAVTWFQREEYDEVIFIVGGTGITPAYQYILHTISNLSPSSLKQKISVIYASSNPSNILLKPELDKLVLENPSLISMHYLVSKPDEGLKVLPKGSDSTLGRLVKKDLEKWIGKGVDGDKNRVVLVSGPEGMVEYVAGPRGRNQSSGPLGGLLKELGYTEKQVVKL